MKKITVKFLSIILFLFTVNFNSSPANAAPMQAAVSFQFFYDGLAPYGSWVSYPGYGYAWVPHVSVGFRPYLSNGHWVYTDLGWTWVSNYDWGWAPFHYGTWVNDPAYGWLWVPGYDWAPAWVVWGTYGDYYGWAPCAPGFSISVGYYPPIDYWCFSHPRYIAAGTWDSYYVARDHRISIGSNTMVTNVNNITVVRNVNNYSGRQFNAGPSRQEFERVSKTPITPVAIKEKQQPGRLEISGGAVAVYRPKVNPADKNTAKPSRVEPIEKVKADRGNTPANGAPSKNVENKNNGRTIQEHKPVDKNRGGMENTNGKNTEKAPPINHQQVPAPKPDHKQQPQMNQQHDQMAPHEKQAEPRAEQRQQVPVQKQNQVAPPSKQMTPHPEHKQQAPVQHQEKQAMPKHQQQMHEPVQRQPKEMNQAEPRPEQQMSHEPQPEPEKKHGPK